MNMCVYVMRALPLLALSSPVFACVDEPVSETSPPRLSFSAMNTL